MAQVLVRDLSQETVDLLKARAAHNGRSLEAELRVILERAGRTDLHLAREHAARIRAALAGREHTDSADLLAEDRAR
jgi:plasmid stability protein